MTFIHAAIFGHAARPARVQYVAYAVVVCISIQVAACVLGKTESKRSFELWSTITVLVVALSTLLIRGTFYTRQVVSTLCLCAWAARLSHFLYKRPDISRKWQPDPTAWSVLPRVIWCLVVSLPVVLNNEFQHNAFEQSEAWGILVFVVGFCLEWAADVQKAAWRASLPPNDVESVAAERPFCTRGVWRYSRNPHYAGEMMVHIGIYALVAPVLPGIVILAPAINLAMLYTGAFHTRDSRQFTRLWQSTTYLAYRARTSPLIPLPNSVYAALNDGAKSSLCCEQRLVISV